MPNYSAHLAINLAGLAALTCTSLASSLIPLPLVTVAASSFAVATFFLSPDLDLRHSNPSKNWWLLKWIWYPYQLAFRHRGWSHSLLLSSIIRVVYLLVAMAVVAVCADLAVAVLSDGWHGLREGKAVAAFAGVVSEAAGLFGRHQPEFAAIGAGIWLSDFLHIAADRLASAVKLVAKP